VARPKVPLISKRKALEVALDIIDNEGIDALSIRRLAERLSVNGASLYHHFENKEEIVVGAAKLALEEVRVPQGHEEPWRVWILRNARRLRAAFLAHPDLVPVMLRREPLGIGSSQLDATAAKLEAEGVPVGAIAPMLEALELYAIGSALHEASNGGRPRDASRTPHLDKAFEQRAMSADEIFEMVCEQIIDATFRVASGVAEAAGGAAPIPRPRPRGRRAGSHTST
jgi:AcrR family transcriptional regulator